MRKLHLWLSVPFGLVITVICFTGAMMALEPEVTRALNREVYYVSPAPHLSPLPLDGMLDHVRETLPDSVKIVSVTVFSDPSRAWTVSLSKPKKAALFLNPYTGEITGRYERPAFFLAMFKLHRWLLDPAVPQGKEGVKIGRTIVGTSAILMALTLATGIALWSVRARRNLRKSLTVTLRNGRKGLWKSLHVAGGMYAACVLLVCSLTGPTWSFEWYKKGFYGLFGVEMSAPSKVGGKPMTESKREVAQWQQRVAEAKEKEPNASEYLIEAEPKPLSDAARLKKNIYNLHTGGFGGTLTRVLWLAAALLGCTLPLTGYYIWFSRLLKRRRNPS